MMPGAINLFSSLGLALQSSRCITTWPHHGHTMVTSWSRHGPGPPCRVSGTPAVRDAWGPSLSETPLVLTVPPNAVSHPPCCPPYHPPVPPNAVSYPPCCPPYHPPVPPNAVSHPPCCPPYHPPVPPNAVSYPPCYPPYHPPVPPNAVSHPPCCGSAALRRQAATAATVSMTSTLICLAFISSLASTNAVLVSTVPDHAVAIALLGVR